jgi:hypothetical protein
MLGLLLSANLYNCGGSMQKVVLILGSCCLLTACGDAGGNYHGDLAMVPVDTHGTLLVFWPPDIIPHPHPPQPEPRDPNEMA